MSVCDELCINSTANLTSFVQRPMNHLMPFSTGFVKRYQCLLEPTCRTNNCCLLVRCWQLNTSTYPTGLQGEKKERLQSLTVRFNVGLD